MKLYLKFSNKNICKKRKLRDEEKNIYWKSYGLT